eukprot:scaffold68801_cov55-Phaeocystis_antarctica.AAC.2
MSAPSASETERCEEQRVRRGEREDTLDPIGRAPPRARDALLVLVARTDAVGRRRTLPPFPLAARAGGRARAALPAPLPTATATTSLGVGVGVGLELLRGRAAAHGVVAAVGGAEGWRAVATRRGGEGGEGVPDRGEGGAAGARLRRLDRLRTLRPLRAPLLAVPARCGILAARPALTLQRGGAARGWE